MDHYIIKKEGVVCHVDNYNELKCDNKYDYNDDTSTKFSIHSTDQPDAQFCIQSKKNNLYANTNSTGVVMFNNESCTPADKFKITFLDVFDVTKFNIEKDGNVCNGTTESSITCTATNVAENNTFTLLQETKPYCPMETSTIGSIGTSIGNTIGSIGNAISGNSYNAMASEGSDLYEYDGFDFGDGISDWRNDVSSWFNGNAGESQNLSELAQTL